MRVLICPDKFAGTLTAVEAAAAIAEGWRAVRPGDDLTEVPLADGGEGTTDVLVHARPDAHIHTVTVADPRGISIDARWVSLPDGTAVVEVAEACGLSALTLDERDPLRATSYGVGQLLSAVFEHRPAMVVVGLGGSATVDGGSGMVRALAGHSFRREDSQGVGAQDPWMTETVSIVPIDFSGRPPVVLASDVMNPLLGPDGAASVFGPQKGANAKAVEELETALSSWADAVERTLDGGPWRNRPGAGAAGGLGFALMAFLDAKVRSGAGVVTDLIGLDLTDMDVMVTGEGRLDAQTLGGKGPDAVRQMAAKAGAWTIALAGVIADDAGRGFDVTETLGPDGLARPRATLAAAAGRAARAITLLAQHSSRPAVLD